MESEAGKPQPNLWRSEDLVFAIRELQQEFPGKAEHLIVAAVHVAAERLPVTNGRVRLVQHAREIMRRSA